MVGLLATWVPDNSQGSQRSLSNLSQILTLLLHPPRHPTSVTAPAPCLLILTSLLTLPVCSGHPASQLLLVFLPVALAPDFQLCLALSSSREVQFSSNRFTPDPVSLPQTGTFPDRLIQNSHFLSCSTPANTLCQHQTLTHGTVCWLVPGLSSALNVSSRKAGTLSFGCKAPVPAPPTAPGTQPQPPSQHHACS